jgi:hypothetical protein
LRRFDVAFNSAPKHILPLRLRRETYSIIIFSYACCHNYTLNVSRLKVLWVRAGFLLGYFKFITDGWKLDYEKLFVFDQNSAKSRKLFTPQAVYTKMFRRWAGRRVTVPIASSVSTSALETSSDNCYCIDSCSVFVKLYINGSEDLSNLEELNNAFRTSYTSGNSYITRFLGRNAININATSPSMGPRLEERTVNDSVHPGCDSDSCPEGDPTLLAVVIGTYVGTCIQCTY